MGMKVTVISENVGKALVAGLAGTVAMTISSTIEQKARGREASTAPARAAEKLLGIEKFRSDAAEQRFSTLVHWAYGTGWGVARGVLRSAGVSPSASTAAHFGAIWGGAAVMLPALGVAPPITTWGKQEIAIDAWHHLVYVTAVAVSYELLDRGSMRSS
jgi:hypothetical protein